MMITGVIRNVDIKRRYFSIKIKKRVYYYYLQNNLIKKFRKYLSRGRFVSFICDDESKTVEGYETYRVQHFIKIIRQRYSKQEIYYDIDVIRDGIKNLLNKMNNVMFLDLEMTMHDYNVSKDFKSEIIQAGYIILDKKGKTLEENSFYVRPEKFPRLTKRTKKFLGITEEILDEGISYKEFYEVFSKAIEKYNPDIIVWGKNDIIALNDSYNLNEVKAIEANYVNLLQLQKNYFNLKCDLGLFKARSIYLGDIDDQVHDALDDAIVTKDVFYAFKKIVNENLTVDFNG